MISAIGLARRCWVTGFVALVLVMRAAGMQAPSGNERSVESLSQVRSLVAEQQWQAAQSRVDAYLAGHPESAEAHALRARVLFELDEPEESIREYDLAARGAALTAQDLKTMGLAFATVGRLDDGARCLSKSVALDGEDLGAWEALGQMQVKLSHPDQAIDAFRHVLLLAPRTAYAATEIGLASEQLNLTEAAAQAFADAIEWQAKDPDPDAVPYIGRGRTLMKLGRPHEALEPLLEAAKLVPRDGGVHNELGRAYRDLNEIERAKDEFELAVSVEPKVALYHVELGQMYTKLGRKQEAKQQFDLYASLREAEKPASVH